MVSLKYLFLTAFLARLYVSAEDVEVSDGDAPEEVEAVEAVAADEVAATEASSDGAKKANLTHTDSEDLKNYADMSQGLLEKLGQLKTLLAQKGDKISPDELQKIKDLEKMLGDLGLSSKPAANPAADKEVTEFFGACIAMSMRRAGPQRASTQTGLSMMAQGKVTPEMAATTDLWKNSVACITRLTDAQYEQFKAGALKILPKEHETYAQSAEIKDEIMNLPAEYWTHMQVVSKGLVGAAPEPSTMPKYYGIIAMVVIVVLVGLATKRLIDMTNTRQDKSSKKEKKKNK